MDHPGQSYIENYEEKKGSWYTLYPYQAQWEEDADKGPVNQIQALKEFITSTPDAPLTLYTHFPFCVKQCFFCQCATVISNSEEHHREIVNYMGREVQLLKRLFDEMDFRPNIREVHFGGGSPSILSEDLFTEFATALSEIADFSSLDECSIEIDPRFNMSVDKMRFYHRMGINRISFGIQDFDEDVMKAVNRINPPDMIRELMPDDVRQLFKSVSFDVLYGLPKQTLAAHRHTIETIIGFKPDRLNVCKLGHRPDVFPHQKAYRQEDRASSYDQVQMKIDSLNMLRESGYETIGFDHFAKPHDDLAIAKQNGTLVRNAMGYSPGRSTDILGIGPSAISTLGRWHTQNYYILPSYYEALDTGKFPVIRSYGCNKDDLIRRRVIFDFILYGGVVKNEIEEAFQIDFETYFSDAQSLLAECIEDGLVEIDDDAIRLTDAGRLNPRHACSAFDRFLHEGKAYAHSREVGDGLKSFDRKAQLTRQ